MQPQVALSNLGYLLAGLILLHHTHWQNPKDAGLSESEPASFGFPRFFAAGLLMAGAFSFFSHASLSRLGEWFDLMGVYLLGGLLVFHNLGRLTPISTRIRLGMIGAALVAGGTQMAIAPWLQQIGIAIFFGCTVLLEGMVQLTRKPLGVKPFLYAALGSYAAGGILWAVGGGPNCTNAVPWHAGWHLLSALAAGLLFFYYRSEALLREPGSSVTTMNRQAKQ